MDCKPDINPWSYPSILSSFTAFPESKSKICGGGALVFFRYRGIDFKCQKDFFFEGLAWNNMMVSLKHELVQTEKPFQWVRNHWRIQTAIFASTSQSISIAAPLLSTKQPPTTQPTDNAAFPWPWWNRKTLPSGLCLSRKRQEKYDVTLWLFYFCKTMATPLNRTAALHSDFPLQELFYSPWITSLGCGNLDEVFWDF